MNSNSFLGGVVKTLYKLLRKIRLLLQCMSFRHKWVYIATEEVGIERRICWVCGLKRKKRYIK